MKTVVALLLVLSMSGCLFRKDVPARWFQPASTLLADRADATPERSGRAVRLRSVQAIAFLRERMAWRLPPVESGLYEQRRWREMPATYVERALTTALAQTPGVRLTDDLRAPVLRVEVLAFDEVVGPTHGALVTLHVVLGDGDRTLLERTLSVEETAQGADTDGVATAMGVALDTIATQVATAVAGALPPARR